MHMHALLAQLVEDLVSREVVSSAHFEPYRSLDITPVDFRVRRDRHEEAVLLLASLLASAVTDTEQSTESVHAR